jgi:Arc/MetJ-type ribon-helix-helix transcriptional regulator
MNTVNVSLPKKLKEQAQKLVEAGYYASFSDLVRDSLRRVVYKSKYDLMVEEAIEDEKRGEAVVLKSKKDIDKYMDSL